MDTKTRIIPVERIAGAIHLVRGVKVMLDSDLAVLYGVQTKALVQAVKRNRERFAHDFMFQLTSQEFASVRSQSVTTSRRYSHAPLVFTELGVAMLSSVLRSPRAIMVNMEIMRAFVQLREFALTHEELTRKFDALEAKFDSGVKQVFDAIRKATAPEEHKPTLGFGRKKIG